MRCGLWIVVCASAGFSFAAADEPKTVKNFNLKDTAGKTWNLADCLKVGFVGQPDVGGDDDWLRGLHHGIQDPGLTTTDLRAASSHVKMNMDRESARRKMLFTHASR